MHSLNLLGQSTFMFRCCSPRVAVGVLACLMGIAVGVACQSSTADAHECYKLPYHSIVENVGYNSSSGVRFTQWHHREYAYWFVVTKRREVILNLASPRETYVRKIAIEDLRPGSRLSSSRIFLAPDDRHLAYVRGGHLSLYSLRRKTIRRIATGAGLAATSLAFSPHGNHLAFVQAHHLYLYSLHRKSRPKLLFPALLFASSMSAVTWVGRNTAVIGPIGRRGQVHPWQTLDLINLKTVTIRVLWKIPPLHGGIWPDAYSRSSHRLFFTTFPGISEFVSHVATLRNGHLSHVRKILVPLVRPHDMFVTDLQSVSKNGVYIVFAAGHVSSQGIGRVRAYLENIDTGRRVCFSNEGFSVSAFSITPGGRWIIVNVNDLFPVIARVAKIPVRLLKRIDQKHRKERELRH